MSGEGKYQGEKVLAVKEGNLEYLVRWEGYAKPTWEPTENFDAERQAINSA